MSTADPSSSTADPQNLGYEKSVSSSSKNSENEGHSSTREIVTLPPSSLREDLRWAFSVSVNEYGGGCKRNWEPLPGKMTKEDPKTFSAESHLEMLKRSIYSESQEKEDGSRSLEKMPDPELSPPPYVNNADARREVRRKLQALMVKLDYKGGEVKSQMEREEEMWLFCTLFPQHYQFKKETLVQLWMGRGFIKDDRHKWDISDCYFDSLLAAGYLQHAGKCFPSSDTMYKVNVTKLQLNEDNISYNNHTTTMEKPLYVRVNSKAQLASNKARAELIENLSFVGSDEYGDVLDQSIFEDIKSFKDLKSLLFLGVEMVVVQQRISPISAKAAALQQAMSSTESILAIPQDLFSTLNQLQVLDLSKTPIANLPSSILHAKELRYLDLSYTLIELLPETIECLHKLQTLKLQGCVRLLKLPQGIVKLTSLCHLDLNVLGQLSYMPKGMGALVKLETLPAFLVDKDTGRGINELRNMNSLKGSFCISQLERVSSREEAKEAALSAKEYLRNLHLRWGTEPHLRGNHHNHNRNNNNTSVRIQKHDYEVLEQLCPPTNVKQLEISCYGGSKFPDWISDSKQLDMLESLVLVRCAYSKLLPSLGGMPYLKVLHLIGLTRVRRIGEEFRKTNASVAFPKLEKLTISGMSKLEKWVGVKEGDFPRLCMLSIERCPKLTTVPSLSCFHALKQMEISHCPKLSPDFARKNFPTSLNNLIIQNCPPIRKSFFKRRGGSKDLSKVEQLKSVWIDDEEIITSYA